LTDPVVVIGEQFLHVEPGDAVQTTLRITNVGDQVEGYSIEICRGPASRWAEAVPNTVHLLPGQDTEVTITFRPPRQPAPPVGNVTFGILVISHIDPDRRAVVDGEIVVAEIHELQARLTPVSARGRHRGRYRIDVDNTGTAPASVLLRASVLGGPEFCSRNARATAASSSRSSTPPPARRRRITATRRRRTWSVRVITRRRRGTALPGDLQPGPHEVRRSATEPGRWFHDGRLLRPRERHVDTGPPDPAAPTGFGAVPNESNPVFLPTTGDLWFSSGTAVMSVTPGSSVISNPTGIARAGGIVPPCARLGLTRSLTTGCRTPAAPPP